MVVARSVTVPVLDSTMYYREAGEGRPVLLLHGNPTSSYLWRHVLASADDGHRWIALDLIGMGGSGKPDIGYWLADHLAYVEAFIDALDLTDLVLVGHDWGVALALILARRRPNLVRGIAVMEGHLRPLDSWDAFDASGRELFQQLRTPGVGERMVLDENFLIDTLLPAGLMRTLSDDELAEYRAPYPDRQSRRPLLQWTREIPVAGEPSDVAALLADAGAHLVAVDLPTLLLHGQPGVLVTPATVTWFRAQLSDLTVVDVGRPAGHFLPEDRPAEVAAALRAWVGELD